MAEAEVSVYLDVKIYVGGVLLQVAECQTPNLAGLGNGCAGRLLLLASGGISCAEHSYRAVFDRRGYKGRCCVCSVLWEDDRIRQE